MIALATAVLLFAVAVTTMKIPQVALHNVTKYNETGSLKESFLCAAVVATCIHVISAAHCHKPCNRLPYDIPGYPCTKDFFADLFVNLGDFNLAIDSEAQNQLIAVESYKLHENYNPDAIGNDIMIVTLVRPITFNGNIRPAYLPSPKVDTDNKLVTAIGWGRTKSGSISSILQQVKLTVVPKENCTTTVPLINPQALAYTLCTIDAEKNGRGICLGDSGGPVKLACQEGHDTVVGIIAYYVMSCGNNDYPSGNTKVDKYIPWILDNTQGMACIRPCTPKENN